jgi:hypothetical protein
MNKRGQFFLIAAFAIIGVIVGLASVYTTAEALPEARTVLDLSKELNLEGASVIDHGTFYGLSREQRIDNLRMITDAHAKSNPKTDFIIIYGNSSNLSVTTYTSQDTGSVGLNIGGAGGQFESLSLSEQRQNSYSLDPQGQSQVTILIDPEDKDIKHTFDLKPGETFFIIAKEERQGERYVRTAI